TLLEHHPHLMMEASAVPARLHCGGEYPLDRTTALDCFHSSLLFWQMIPYGYTDIPAVTYVLDQQTHNAAILSNDEEGLSLNRMLSQYKEIQGYYYYYYNFLKEDLHFSDDQLFGPPEHFCRVLEKEELDINGFVGGIVTHERGLNPVLLGLYLEDQLRQAGVRVNTSHHVTSAKEKPYGYKIYTQNNQKFKAHLVVNASFDKAIETDMKAFPMEDPYLEDLHVFLRGMAAFDISGCKLPEVMSIPKGAKKKETEKGNERKTPRDKTAIFGLLGENGGMVSPFNDQVAWGFWPSRQGSYLSWSTGEGELIDRFPITSTAQSQQQWDYLSQYETYLQNNKDERIKKAQAILDNLTIKYPFLRDARPLDLIVRRILSPCKQTYRQHDMVHCFGKEQGWLRALSLKATFAPLTALQVVRLSLEYFKILGLGKKSWSYEVIQAKEWLDLMHHWMELWQLPPKEVPRGISLPSLFRLPAVVNHVILGEKAKKWAEDRGLPREIVSDLPLKLKEHNRQEFEEANRASINSFTCPSPVISLRWKQHNLGW
ncbi:MAG TPA: hypothetical protein VNJ29_03645, partial [Candidatus Nitrosotenuis sp.]|nr:hypothetical protein [Candidatus Nitrosotenuis sp.]